MSAKLEVKIDQRGICGFSFFLSREMTTDIYNLFIQNNLTTEVDQMVEKTLVILVGLYAEGLNRLRSNSIPGEFEGVQTLCTLLSVWAPSFRNARPVLFRLCGDVLKFVKDMDLADPDFKYNPWIKPNIETIITKHFS